MPAPSPTRRARLAGTLLSLVLLAATSLFGVAATVLATAAPAAAACSCQPAGTEALARRATDVFTGTVSGSTLQRGAGERPSVFIHEVTVEMVYKGGIREQVVQVLTESTTRGSCGLGRLDSGSRVGFLVRDVEGMLTAGGCSGTGPATPRLVAALDRLYPNAAPPRPELEPVEAEFTPVAGVDEPTPVTRTVAPGVALVIVGLLGLALARRLGRRHG